MDDLFLFGSGQPQACSKKLIHPDARLAEEMQLDEDNQVYCFEGTRSFDELPYRGLFQAWTPKEIGEKISLEHFTSPFLIAAVEEAALQRVTRAHQVISAKVATPHHASVMGVQAGHPILAQARLLHCHGGRFKCRNSFARQAYRPVTMLERSRAKFISIHKA
jgi:DNA-binding GntR family transcriptional regulator